jgi:hypothetical protein
MAVNVGYSIGWGYPVEINDGAKFFSVCFVLVGASAVAAAVGYFAQTMIESSQDWYLKYTLIHKRWSFILWNPFNVYFPFLVMLTVTSLCP